MNLCQLRRADRDDSASFGYDVSEGEILTRDGAVLAAIFDPQVEIDEGADVVTLRNWKPGWVGGIGYRSKASEAY